MKLEQQVVSLELAQKLKELGVKQESLYYWAECCGLIADAWHDQETGEWGDLHRFKDRPHYSAFTVAELIEAIGAQFCCLLLANGSTDEWTADSYKKGIHSMPEYGSTPTEAVARLWLALNKDPKHPIS